MLLESIKKAEDFTSEEFSAKESTRTYIEACIRDADKTDFFVRYRFNEKTIKKYYLGYDAQKQAIVFPLSSELDCYQTYSLVDKAFSTPHPDNTALPIFNPKGLWVSKKKPVFVVMTPINAISILQCGGNAIALCNVDINQFIETIKVKKPTSPLIISLDHDTASQKTTALLVQKLTKLAVDHIVYNVASSEKELNELLVGDDSKLIEQISQAEKEVLKKYPRGLGCISAQDILNKKIAPPAWLIHDILPQGLAVLCAASKIGKSWMALQMCLAISQGLPFLDYSTNQAECIYLPLEDGEWRLQSRLKKFVTSETCPNFYMMNYAPTLEDNLIKRLDEELDDHPNVKLVIIDTLQKIRGSSRKNELAYATDYREIGALKEFADRRKICILLIHHLRKEVDAEDVFNMISGSTGIMGVADTTFIIYKKQRMDHGAVLSMTGRDIRQAELEVHFDESTCTWQRIGDASEQALKRRKAEYDNNPLVKTIRQLLKESPFGWRGTASELLQKVYDITDVEYLGGSAALGKNLASLDADLYIIDKIKHTIKRTSAQKTHIFEPCQSPQPILTFSNKSLHSKD